MAQSLEAAVEEFNSEHQGEGISAAVYTDTARGPEFIAIEIDGQDTIYVDSVNELNRESRQINILQDQLER